MNVGEGGEGRGLTVDGTGVAGREGGCVWGEADRSRAGGWRGCQSAFELTWGVLLILLGMVKRGEPILIRR